MPLAERLRHWGRRHPDRVACAVGDERASYGDLLGASAALDRLIAAQGEPSERRGKERGRERTRPLVAVSIPNSVAFVRGFVAAACADAVVAVLDPSWSAVQLTGALELLAPDLLLTLDPATAARAAALGTPTVPADALVGTRPEPGAPRARDLDAPFLIGFTSGTSSRPKAYLRTRRSWRDSLERSAEVFAARADSVTLAPGPLAHGLTLYALAESLFGGGTFVTTPRFDLPAIAAAAHRHRPTRFVAVPTAYRRVLADAATRSALAGVRTFVAGGAKTGAALPADVFAAAPGCAFFEYYGASELSFVSVRRATADPADPADLADLTDPANVGRPFPGVEVQVRGADGAVLEEGQVGTVFVRSTLVSQGYLTPEPTGFRRVGAWCTVGDTGFLRSGELHVLGREGEMVVVGGNNTYPSEVEAVLRSHPGVRDGYVVVVDEPGRGETLVAALGADDVAALDLVAVRDHLSARLPRYQVPRLLAVVGAWPMTASGKVSKRALRAAVESRALPVVDWR